MIAFGEGFFMLVFIVVNVNTILTDYKKHCSEINKKIRIDYLSSLK